MDAYTKRELNAIKDELQSIINELDRISDGVRSDFRGIGNDTCANCIDRVISQYRSVRRQLNKIDTSKVNEGYGGGGR